MGDEIDRRSLGVGLAAVAGAVLLKDAVTAAQPHPQHAAPQTLLAAPAEKAVVPLPFAPEALPGLSARLLTSHHDNNYGGAVRKLNEIRQQIAGADPAQAGAYWSLYGSLKAAELAARNSAALHELYFANLAAGQQPAAPLAQMLAQRFNGVDRFQALFRGAAKAANGWVVLVADVGSRTLEIVQTEGHAYGAWEAAPLLVLDVYEHAYALDYGADRNAYFDAFWRNVGWTEVQARATRALARM